MNLEPHNFVAGTPRAADAPPTPPILEAILEAVRPRTTVPDDAGLILGTLAGWDEAGQPLVAFARCPAEAPIAALTTVPLTLDHVGREVALLFVGGNPRRPLVIGLLQPPGPAAPVPLQGKVVASVDGERLEFTAGREIVFRCGDASIVLTRAGKVLIQGAY